MDTRFGIGYDVHRLVNGRKLFLGGIEIPFAKGLEGHSDADVLLHAVCDAVLGALGEGDIGEHFPDTDAQYKNISSMLLLEKVCERMKTKGYTIGNVDCIVLAEEPKLKEHKQAIKENIARALECEASRVNVKATTQEGLGAIGRQEGIAAFASAVIIKNS